MKKLFICALLILPAIAFAADPSPAHRRLADIPLGTIVTRSEVGELRPLTTDDALCGPVGKVAAPSCISALRKINSDSYQKVEVTLRNPDDIKGYFFVENRGSAPYFAWSENISDALVDIFVEK